MQLLFLHPHWLTWHGFLCVSFTQLVRVWPPHRSCDVAYRISIVDHYPTSLHSFVLFEKVLGDETTMIWWWLDQYNELKQNAVYTGSMSLNGRMRIEYHFHFIIIIWICMYPLRISLPNCAHITIHKQLLFHLKGRNLPDRVDNILILRVT